MMYDGLFCAFDNCAMGLGTERYNGSDGVSRERQDAFSAQSHERAAAAIKDGQFAGPSPSLLPQPSHATSVALAKAGLTTSDIDIFEINEAFAAVGVASAEDLGISDDKVNVNGG